MTNSNQTLILLWSPKAGQGYLGKQNYHCSNHLYGYDDKYAYAWVYCSGFMVKNNNELEEGTGFSIPLVSNTDNLIFYIFAYNQPGMVVHMILRFDKFFLKVL